jgi:uncharacterized DUF497 family protein
MFEWDERKSEWTLLERGFDFAYAATIFLGPLMERDDMRRDYGENRILATGEACEGDILTVAYTWRGENRRIISARLASRSERRDYKNLYA